MGYTRLRNKRTADMMNEIQKDEVNKRLNRIEGQVRGIINMVNNDRYCIDILTQTKAIISAVEKVDNIIIKQHLNTCVVNAMESGDQAEKEKKIDEVIKIFAKYRD